MPRTLRTAGPAAVVMALLLGASARSAAAVPLAEDVDFGCGLIEQRFYLLGAELLEQRLGEIESDAQKRRIYSALSTAHATLAHRTRPDLTPAEDKRRRAEHTKAASQYRTLLLKSGAGARGSFEELMGLATEARRLQSQLSLAASDAARKELVQIMCTTFESAIDGLEKLSQQAAKALERHEEKEPENLRSKAYSEWDKQLNELKEKDLRIGVDLNRARYWYAKALPASDAAKKKAVLEKAAEALEDYVSRYAAWVYSIVGDEALARAQLDLGRHADAALTCELALELIRDFLEQDPNQRAAMLPWQNRILGSFVLSLGGSGQYAKADATAKRHNAPEVQIAWAEVLLIRARNFRAQKRVREAEAIEARAKAALDDVAKVSEYWRHRSGEIFEKYDPRGASYAAAFSKWQQDVRARNNPEIIAGAAKLLAFGEAVPAEKQIYVLRVLAAIYRQERMYLEAYVVYAHVAAASADDDESVNSAKGAVNALEGQYNLSKDPVDRDLLDAAKQWRRDNFEGPGIEYGRAVDLKKKGEHEDAIREFGRVSDTSLYYEPALEQIGECHVQFAKQLQKTKPAESARHLALGRDALLLFLEKARRPAQLPKIIQLRKQFEPAAVYRLAAIYMWPGKEDHEACIEATEGYVKRFPDATNFHPYALFDRVKALVAIGRLEQAEADLIEMQRACADMKDKKKAGLMGSYAIELLSNAHRKAAAALRADAADKDAQAAKTADAEQAAALRKQADELRAQAVTVVNKALDVVAAAISANPDNIPYDKFWFVIVELLHQKRPNELSRFAQIFLDRFGDKKGLTPKQANEVDDVVIMLIDAYGDSGQNKEAYDAAVETYKILDDEFNKAGGDINKAPRHYWTVQKQIAGGARILAQQDGADKEKYLNVAMRMYGDLRKVLKTGSDDWWDITISMIEVQNIAGRYEGNILPIKRTLATQPGLGGGEFRERYTRALEDMYEHLKGNKNGSTALELLLRIRTADLETRRNEKKYAEMLRVIRSVGEIAGDYGGDDTRKKFEEFAAHVLKNAKDAAITRDAEELLKKLRNRGE
ncbi:MAG: hypothetical protein ABIF82_02980 [Planctomycetota bacterium]